MVFWGDVRGVGWKGGLGLLGGARPFKEGENLRVNDCLQWGKFQGKFRSLIEPRASKMTHGGTNLKLPTGNCSRV